jgi:hypothetical protein
MSTQRNTQTVACNSAGVLNIKDALMADEMHDALQDLLKDFRSCSECPLRVSTNSDYAAALEAFRKVMSDIDKDYPEFGDRLFELWKRLNALKGHFA